MSIGRPMNEYEGALFSALMTLIKTVVSLADGPAADVMTDERIVTVYLGSQARNE